MNTNKHRAIIDEMVFEPEPEPKRYLTWGVELGWQIQDVKGIAKNIEHQYYSGVPDAAKFFILDDERGEQYPVTVAQLHTRVDYVHDYGYTSYRIGTGKDAEEFTIKIDLRG